MALDGTVVDPLKEGEPPMRIESDLSFGVSPDWSGNRRESSTAGGSSYPNATARRGEDLNRPNKNMEG